MVSTNQYEHLTSQVENPFSRLIPEQTIAIVPEFTLESGQVLHNVPVAYSTRGRLSTEADNAMVICHALSGSADVSDWWGPLIGGPGRCFDVSRFFIICINALGSPYGSASPVTAKDGDPAQGNYGPEFPLTTIRDDVRLSKLLLDDLGVKQIAAVVGGSMGGMNVLEFAYLGHDYVKCIVPIATSAQCSAWCISWGENQRQCIFGDPKYEDGYYSLSDPPKHGLSEARGSALLTYRSRDSFETRFGRKPSRNPKDSSTTPSHPHFAIHNEGHKKAGSPRSSNQPSGTSTPPNIVNGTSNGSAVPSNPISTTQASSQTPSPTNGLLPINLDLTDPQFHGSTKLPTNSAPNPLPFSTLATTQHRIAATNFSAHSYLRYQKEKFVARFDANCYISITRKIDTHDLSVHCPPSSPYFDTDPLKGALQLIVQPTLVLGIQSDGLFTFAEQQLIAESVPNARLEEIESPEGHDAFLLQFKQVNASVLRFLEEFLPWIYEREPTDGNGRVMAIAGDGTDDGADDGNAVQKSSTFGEAEVGDITAW